MARKPAFISHSPEREAQIQSRMLNVLEARFRRRFAAAIVAEAGRILAGYRDLGYVPPVSDDHMQDLRRVYQQLALDAARVFGRRVMTQGKAMGFALETKQETLSEFFRALALAWINLEPIRRRIQSVSETTRAQIVALVARGQDEGLGVDAIARDIEDRLPDIGRYRGALIARTETHGAANYAMHETAKSTGLELEKEWVSVEDARTRSIPRDDAFDHVAMNGQRRPMDEPFDMPWVGGAGEPLKIMYPGQAGLPGGATINCLPPWALVRLAGIKRVMRCKYIGDLFEFSFAGPINFTVTANHPILTMSGWKPARHVVKGDKLIYCGIGDGLPIRRDADIKNGHARVDQLYDTLKPLSDVVRADLNTVNFHGDMPNSDVDIVSAHGELRDAMIVEGLRLFGEITLADTHISKGLLLARRMAGLSDFGPANHSDGFMSALCPSKASLGSGHNGLPSVAFADIGPSNVHVAQATVDHAARDIKGLGDRVDAVTIPEHALNFRQKALSNDAPPSMLRTFQAVEVTAIKRFHYDGPVYNCETDTGLIVSDGIVNHNCRCAVVHQVRGGLLGD